MDALLDLKSESVKKTRTENLIPNTSSRQDSPSRQHVGLPNGSVQSHVTVVHEVTTSGGGRHRLLVSVCWRGR